MMTRDGGSGEGVTMTQARVCENGLDVIFLRDSGGCTALPHVGELRHDFTYFSQFLFLNFFCFVLSTHDPRSGEYLLLPFPFVYFFPESAVKEYMGKENSGRRYLRGTSFTGFQTLTHFFFSLVVRAPLVVGWANLRAALQQI